MMFICMYQHHFVEGYHVTRRSWLFRQLCSQLEHRLHGSWFCAHHPWQAVLRTNYMLRQFLCGWTNGLSFRRAPPANLHLNNLIKYVYHSDYFKVTRHYTLTQHVYYFTWQNSLNLKIKNESCDSNEINHSFSFH